MMSKTLTILFSIFGLYAASCTAAEDEPNPSPLADFDKTRLWILSENAKSQRPPHECSLYFRTPDTLGNRKPGRCVWWSLNFTDFLRVNGLPTLHPRHVQNPGYWNWLDARRQQRNECSEEVQRKWRAGAYDGDPNGYLKKNKDRDACGGMVSNGPTYDKLGISRPPDMPNEWLTDRFRLWNEEGRYQPIPAVTETDVVWR